MLTLKSVTRIAANGMHNAFTSLCQWQAMTYVAYRQGQTHNTTPPGHIVIQRSVDLETWEIAATLHTGCDDRDPHLVPTAEALYCVWGMYAPMFDPWSRRLTTQGYDICTYGASTEDGTAWGPPYRLCRPGSWLWSMVEEPVQPQKPRLLTRTLGREADVAPPASLWYGVSYDVGDGAVDRCHTVTLWKGLSPVFWERWATIIDACQRLSDLQPSEPALFWKAPETLACVIRTEENAYYGEAYEPYALWSWQDLGIAIHAPAVLYVPGMGWIVAGREYVPGKKKTDKPQVCGTSIWRLHCEEATAKVTRLVRLPSEGDCSYPGLVWDEARQEVLISWYSQHEREVGRMRIPVAADVYLARLTVRGDK